MRWTWRGSLGTIATALLAVAAIGAPASAATLHVTFQAVPDTCVRGTANGPFKLELRSPANVVLDTVDPVTPDPDGSWLACFTVDFVSSGKRLRATGEGPTGTVSFAIPTLTANTDRASDVVSGKAPAGHQVKIRLYDCNHLDFACHFKAARSATANGSGHYSKDMSSAFDARGFDEARVRYTSSAGHTFTVTTVFSWLAVAPNESLVFGESRSGRQVVFRLFSKPGGTLLKTRKLTPEFVDYDFHFSTPTSKGRQVTADFANDAKLTIPSTSVTFDVDGSDTTLHVRCLPGRKVMVDLNPGPDIVVTADSHGRADVTVATSDFDPATVGVILTCQSAAGDVITHHYDAPLD